MNFRKRFSIATLVCLPLASISFTPSLASALESHEINQLVEGKSTKQALTTVANKYVTSRFSGVQLKNESSDSLGYKTALVSSNISEFGPMVANYRQYYDGIPVHGKSISVLLDKNYSLVKLEGELSQPQVLNYSPFYSDPQASAKEALKTAYAAIGINATVDDAQELPPSRHARVKKQNNAQAHLHKFNVAFNHENFSPFNVSRPTVKRVWYVHQGFLVPAFQVAFNLEQKDKDNMVVSHTLVVSEKPQDESEMARVLTKQSFSLQSPHTYRTFANNQTGSPFDKPYWGPYLNPYPIIGETLSSSKGRFPLSFAPESINLVTTENGPRTISEPRPWHYEQFPDTYGINAIVLTNFNNYFTPNDVGSINFEDDRLFQELISSIALADFGLTFDATYDHTQPASRTSRDAALVYAFYLTNWLHDYFYDFGFDEASGNGQAINYTGEGFAGDPLIVLAQSGRSIAQLVPGPDGISSVMVLPYLHPQHNDETLFVDVNINGEVSRLEGVSNLPLGPAGFTDIKGELVNVAISGTGTDCSIDQSTPDLTDKIALVTEFCDGKQILSDLASRGVSGVIVTSLSGANVTNENLLETQLPPALRIRNSSATDLVEQLSQGDAVEVEMHKDTIYAVDYAVDTSTVVHEWAHYMITRLAGERPGGLNELQGVSLNEGWADFIAMYFNIHENDSRIVGNEYYQGVYSLGTFLRPATALIGDRRVPYTTDTSLNATTFKNISSEFPFEFDHEVENRNASPFHGPGEIWATAMLEVYTALLNDRPRLSFDEARRRMGHYIVNGLKMTPEFPTFTDARDALLAVAYATDKADFELMKIAFAKRGMGANAISPPNDSNFRHIGVVESFKVNAESFAISDAKLAFEADFESLDPVLREDSDLAFSNRLSAFNRCPKDGTQDQYEYGEVIFTVENRGNVDAQTTISIESSNPFITFPNDGVINTQLLSPIKTANDKQEFRVPFFVIAAQKQEQTSFTIDFDDRQSDVTYSDATVLSDLFNFDLVNDGNKTIEDFSSNVSLLDWSVDIERPSVEDAQYRQAVESVSIQPFHNSNNMLVIESLEFVSDVNVTSNKITVSESEDFAISFNASWEFQSFLGTPIDGLFMEISIDGGPWANVTEQGGIFVEGGYNGQLTGEPRYLDALGNIVFDIPEPAFTDTSSNQFDSEGNLTNITRLEFGKSLANKEIQFRFHSRTNDRFGRSGFQVDNINIEGATDAGLRSIVDNRLFCNRNNRPSPSFKSSFFN